MLRTDLPPGERRGIKPISNIAVTYGPDGQPRRLQEFKPTDAPGLPTATTLVKNSRVYFIKLPGNVIAVIDIAPRAQQDEILRELRNKAKRTPGGKKNTTDITDEA